MTWRCSAWIGRFRLVLAGCTVVFAAIAALPWLDDATSHRDRLIVTAIMLATWLLVAVLHTWITVEPGQVRFGYFPFYRRTLPYSEVVQVEVVDIRPFAEFGGWG